MTKHIFIADALWNNNTVYEHYGMCTEDGMITRVDDADVLKAEAEKNNIPITVFKDSALFPGFVNTHNHSFQSLLKGVADDKDFFTWRNEALYKYSNVITPDDLYTGALFAFGEMLKAGITTVCDFFYINAQSNSNAEQIIQAAKDLGIRFVLARTFYDWDGAPKCYQETPEQAVHNTEALLKHYETDPLVSIIPAPHSLHGASETMIKAASELATQYQLPCHMHIAEGEYERQMILEKYGKTPIALLKEWGVLNDRLVGIHCVWVDDHDLDLMQAANAMVSYNPSSNMFLGDGITPITKMLERNITIGLGTDGGCSNNRASIVEEMRMCALLQKVNHCDGTVISAEDVLKMGTFNTERILGLRVGKLLPGCAADFVVLNLNDISLQPQPFWPKQVVYSMQPSAITASYVAGKAVYSQGEILGVSEKQIVSKIQTLWKNWKTL